MWGGRGVGSDEWVVVHAWQLVCVSVCAMSDGSVQNKKKNLHGVPRTAASIKLLEGLLPLTLFDFPLPFSPVIPPTPAVHVGSSSCNLVFECFTLGLALLIGMDGAEAEREEASGYGFVLASGRNMRLFLAYTRLVFRCTQP